MSFIVIFLHIQPLRYILKTKQSGRCVLPRTPTAFPLATAAQRADRGSGKTGWVNYQHVRGQDKESGIKSANPFRTPTKPRTPKGAHAPVTVEFKVGDGGQHGAALDRGVFAADQQAGDVAAVLLRRDRGVSAPHGPSRLAAALTFPKAPTLLRST